MKKVLLFFALINVCSAVFSQETEETQETTEIKQETKEVRRSRVNELRIGVNLPLYFVPEISYERTIKNKFGLGVSTGPWLLQNVDLGEAAVFIMPYGRYYFFKPLFIEANTVLANIRSNSNGSWDTIYGIGLASGAKFSLKHNFTVETSLGAGFLFGYSYSSENPAMYFLFRISFGIQF